MAAAKKVDYSALEKQRAHELETEFQKKLESKSLGKIDSLRHTVLTHVVSGNYEMALHDLDRYVDMQSEYPAFKIRAERYITHCKEVMNAVETKKNLPGLQSLPLAKQQEVFESVLGHFEELKHFLKKVESVEKDVKLDDLKSTVWVIKAFTYCIFALLVILFCKEAYNSIYTSFDATVDAYMDDAANWVVETLF